MNMFDSLSQFGPLKLLDPISIISETVNLDLTMACDKGTLEPGIGIPHILKCKVGYEVPET